MPESLHRETESTSDYNEPDYAAIEVPTDTPPSELHYTQRRAELYQIVMAAGDPTAVSQAQLADRFEVNQSTISRDLDRLDEYLRQNATGRRDLDAHAVYRRCRRGLLENEEYLNAAKVQKWYEEFRDSRVSTLEFRARLDRLEDIADRGGR